MEEANAARAGATAAGDVRPPLKVGVWVDDPIGQIDGAYARRLKAIGITEACLMTNKSNAHEGDEPWKLLANEETIVHAAQNLRNEGLEVVLTCWPRPAREQITKLHAAMRELMRDTRAVALEVDAEANWHHRFLAGFTTMEHAAQHLVDSLRDAAPGARVEMTTFAQHTENGHEARIAPLVDRVFPQAYSVNERGGKIIPWDHPYGPGRMQELSIALAKQTGCPSIGCGLAAYEQRFAGHTPEEAMKVAIERARALGVDHVRYWSSKWIVGSMGTAWARKAIASASS